MNTIADTIKNLDDALHENWLEQRLVHQTMYYYHEYGEKILTPAGKRRIKKLTEQRAKLEKSANAAYRM